MYVCLFFFYSDECGNVESYATSVQIVKCLFEEHNVCEKTGAVAHSYLL